MNITIYGRTNCSYCPMVKRFLDSKKQVYEYVNLDDTPELGEEVICKSGVTTVPVTIFKNGDQEKIVIGYNIPSLVRALDI